MKPKEPSSENESDVMINSCARELEELNNQLRASGRTVTVVEGSDSS